MFTVVSMVREDASVLQRFIEYYISQGADRISLYYDGICPIQGDAWPEHKVVIQNIDDEFKSKNASGDPKDLIATQEMVFKRAHLENTSEWLLVVDADEFICVPGSSIAHAMQEVNDSIESLRFPVGEAVWGPEDKIGKDFGCTYFRLPMNRLIAKLISKILYGSSSHLFRHGVLGHAGGKHAVRNGVCVDSVGCHYSRRNGKPIGYWSDSRKVGLAGSFVAHFDAISFERWREKWSRRINDDVRVHGMGRGRSMQVHEAGLAAERGMEFDHFKTLYSISKKQVMLLTMLGSLRRANIVQQPKR